jgi:hypothetical protein
MHKKLNLGAAVCIGSIFVFVNLANKARDERKHEINAKTYRLQSVVELGF